MASWKTKVCLGKENICKNCIKADVCKVLEDFYKDTFYGRYIQGCDYFKDHNRFVELPCKVGDTVYVKTLFGDYAEAEVRDYSYFISCGFCVVVTSTKFDKHHIPFSKFGKTVFLTREEAEQALKESENNDRRE